MATSFNLSFTDKVTSIATSWLNGVNTLLNKIASVETAAAADAGKSLTIDSSGNVELTNLSASKNIVWNPDFDLWQRGTAFAAAVSSANYYPDAWQYSDPSTGSQVTTVQQSSDVPTKLESGHTSQYSCELLVTTGATDQGATDIGRLVVEAEGVDAAALEGENITVSFWVKCSVAGTYTLSVGAGDGTENYPVDYTISVADTWEKKTITLDFTPPVNGVEKRINRAGLTLDFLLFVGTSFDEGTSGAWNDDLFSIGTANATNTFYDTTNNSFKLTQVQVEKGSIATAFNKLPAEIEYNRAQRIFRKSYAYDLAPGAITLQGTVVTLAVGSQTDVYEMQQGIDMANTPTINWYSPDSGASGNLWNETDDLDVAVSTTTHHGPKTTGIPTITAQTANDILHGHWTASTGLI